MKEFQYTIKDELGIHARPAGVLAKFAKNLGSKVVIAKGDKSADAARLMSVMGMAIKQGEQITVTVEGETEEADVKQVQAFFEENL